MMLAMFLAKKRIHINSAFFNTESRIMKNLFHHTLKSEIWRGNKSFRASLTSFLNCSIIKELKTIIVGNQMNTSAFEYFITTFTLSTFFIFIIIKTSCYSIIQRNWNTSNWTCIWIEIIIYVTLFALSNCFIPFTIRDFNNVFTFHSFL